MKDLLSSFGRAFARVPVLFVLAVCAVLCMPLLAESAAGADAAAILADIPSADQALLAKLAVHAAAIAGFIRLLVWALKSPMLSFIWIKVPVAARPALLILLGALAAAFDAVGLGTPVHEAIFAAFGGVFGAVWSHESQDAVTGAKAKKAAAKR